MIDVDAWFIVTGFITYDDIARLSVVNKELNSVMNHSAIWEQQCRLYFNADASVSKTTNDEEEQNDAVVDNHRNRFKSHFQSFIQTYGHDSIWYYERVMHCWTSLTKWSKLYLPQLLTTFNAVATSTEIAALKQEICSTAMLNSRHYDYLTPYLLFLGECANGQKIDLGVGACGMYGYYRFYNKVSAGHLLSIADAVAYTELIVRRYGKNVQDLWLFCGGFPGNGFVYQGDMPITVPCLTFIDGHTGHICKLTGDAQVLHLKHMHSNSFLEHLEWYILHNVTANNYRVDPQRGILRFPLSDAAVSESMTQGIVCRASPLFVPEVSSITQRNFIFPYHIEIECPTNYYDIRSAQGQDMKRRCEQCPSEKNKFRLQRRKWVICDDGKTETVQGDGVIGMYPEVFVNQKLFSYESCSQQNVPSNGTMGGSFIFERELTEDSVERFEMQVATYKLDWDMCQWI